MKGETDYFATFKCMECSVLTDLDAIPPFGLPTREAWNRKHGTKGDGDEY